jgi:hypothetical protein
MKNVEQFYVRNTSDVKFINDTYTITNTWITSKTKGTKANNLKFGKNRSSVWLDIGR